MPDEAKDTTNNKPEEPKPDPPPHHDDVSTETVHTVTIDGRPVEYTATAGHMVIKEEEGKKQASFFSVSYIRNDVTNRQDRPVVFCFNGGPGSSSVWLHLGALGPRRVVLEDDGMPVPPPGRLADNEYSILDAADLVFIDPVSTGYSRAIPEEEAKTYHHFRKDLESVGEFIRLWLARNHRWGSPKLLAGESYGTTRAAGLAGHLLKRHGLYFNGLILISSILNFQTAGFDPATWTFLRGNDLPYVLFLPSYAATAWYHGKLSDEFQALTVAEVVAEVEAFASTEYAAALIEGSRLSPDRRQEMVTQVARYTGLSETYVDQSDLRIEILQFCKELLRAEARTVGRIDSRFTGIDRLNTGHMVENDPSIDATMGVYTSALNHYLNEDLEYHSDLPYEILTDRVHPWDYEEFKNAFVDVSETLRETMSRNPFMKVFVGNGYFDLATPHFATEYTFAHLGLDASLQENVSMAYYEAGHMMYVHLESLAAMHRDLVAFIADASGSGAS